MVTVVLCGVQITSLATSAHNSKKDVCVVAGGETTVTIQGSGRGGRNQEMVLAAGLQLHQGFSTLEDRQAAAAAIYFLSAGKVTSAAIFFGTGNVTE